jgi:hypothetical protein
MIGPLAPAHLALVLVAAAGTVLLGAALAMVRAARRRHATHTISAATVADAWGRWADGRDLSDPERALRNALLELLDAAALAAVRDDLERLEVETLARDRPLLAVREELMASVDRRMLNTEVLRLPDAVKARVRAHSQELQQSDAEARRYIAANEWRLHVLREYAALRYGDKADGDWFAVYERAAQLKQRSLRSALERALEGGASDPRAAQIASVDDELKRRLLTVPPGARFPTGSARDVA